MQRFLQYELDRYLLGRSTEQKKELPLSRVENQDYIHYRKGSLVMYALQDYIGEDNLNRAIRAFRDEHAFKGPPYPNTTQLLAHIRAVTPPHLPVRDRRHVRDDHAVRQPRDRGQGEGAARRPLRGDDEGRGQEAPRRRTGQGIRRRRSPTGSTSACSTPTTSRCSSKRRRSTARRWSSRSSSTGKPARAGIDPYNKLIDRRPKDNAICRRPELAITALEGCSAITGKG